MKKYFTIWLIILFVVGFEYYALNFAPHLSMLLILQKKGFISEAAKISPDPGKRVSLWLGWIGLGLMTIMNVYSMRKRFGFMQSWGKLSDWLSFHVFCGLVGPTFILFHCNFKVRGLVAISFWSMVISFSSGIIGRYFYVQILKEKNFFENEAIKFEQKILSILEKAAVKFDQAEFFKIKVLALSHAGIPRGDINGNLNPFTALMNSIIGDIRLSMNPPQRGRGWPPVTEYFLSEFAINKRRSLFLAPFQQLMGYWHTFHFPFAIFMYVVAAIHVAVALVLGV